MALDKATAIECAKLVCYACAHNEDWEACRWIPEKDTYMHIVGKEPWRYCDASDIWRVLEKQEGTAPPASEEG